MTAKNTEQKLKTRGTYALILHLSRAQTIRIGARGEFKFPRGHYLYIGSAMNGLTARLARHLRSEKKLRWHIDYFLQHAQVKEVWTHQGDERIECVWARAALAMPYARVIAPRFGASDCDCATHLVYFAKRLPSFSVR